MRSRKYDNGGKTIVANLIFDYLPNGWYRIEIKSKLVARQLQFTFTTRN